MGFWTYQTKPTNFKMEQMLRAASWHGGVVAFQPRSGGKGVRVGDTVYLCETAANKNPGVLGRATVLSLASDLEMPEWQQEFWVGKQTDNQSLSRLTMSVDCIYGRRITREELKASQVLCKMAFASGYLAV
jgi:predicted RNA-binding protein with PUA-like domain